MRSLVTGGCGFIGSHIVDRLIEDGHDVIVIDDLSADCNEEIFYNKKARYYHISITEYDSILPLFKDVNYVFHLAAESRIQPTLENPQKACLVNFVGTCNVLQASRTHNIDRLIYSSTSSGYGLKNEPPLLESMSRDCLNPYAVTKVAAEDLVKMYYTLWGLETVIFRYFNVFGERSPTKGQYAPVVGIFLKQKENGEKLTIVGDGSQTRDFIHVKDVVEANILAGLCENVEICGEIFNIGSGHSISILELAKIIDKTADFNFLPKREGEADNTLANISKARKFLNFEPKYKVEEWVSHKLL